MACNVSSRGLHILIQKGTRSQSVTARGMAGVVQAKLEKSRGDTRPWEGQEEIYTDQQEVGKFGGY